MHRRCCNPPAHQLQSCQDTDSGACAACLWRCSLQQPGRGMADVAIARKGRLSLLTYEHRMLQHPRMLLCLCSFAGDQCAAHSPGHALCAAQQGQADVCGCFIEAQGLVWHFSPNFLRMDLVSGCRRSTTVCLPFHLAGTSLSYWYLR